MKRVVIADSCQQVEWALKEKIELIVPVSIESQFCLLKNGIDFSYYLKLNPDKKTSQKFIDLGEKFANSWFVKHEDRLEIDGANFGVFCRMHWLFFLPELLRAYYVSRQIVHKYAPDEVIIFSKNENLEVVNDERPLEAFVLKTLSASFGKKIAVIEKVSDTLNNQAGQYSLTNIKRYFNYFSRNPLDILIALDLLIGPEVSSDAARISKADIVLHTQRHIITDSLPLISAIKTTGFKFLIIADSLLLLQRIQLSKNKVEYLDYREIITNGSNSFKSRSLNNFWKWFKEANEYKQFLKSLDLAHLKVAIDLQFEALFEIFTKDVSKAMETANTVLSQSTPKVMLLTGNSGRRGLAFGYVARKKKITSFLFQHGVDIKPVQSSNVFDFKIVWGKHWQKWYGKQMHLPEKKFFPAGWFYVDNLTKKIKTWEKFLENRSKKTKATVFFPLAYYVLDNYKLLKIVCMVIEEFSKAGGLKLIIRPHPGQNFPIGIEKFIAKADVEWDLGKDLDTQLQQADVVLSLGTTVGLRAMVWRRPVIHLKTLDVIDETDFSKFGAGVMVSRIEQLIPTVRKLLNQPGLIKKINHGQQRFIAENCNRLDGKSSLRVLDFIRQMTKL